MEPVTPPERRVSTPSPISTDQWRQLESLVDTLLDTPPERRATLFAEMSGGNPERRLELERLVAECERAHPLFDQSAAERFSGLVDDHAVRASEVLADRYRITRELGRGGMATVYLARDIRHSRDVAVKVVRAELSAALGGGRFLREIEIVAALRHPHIVPLYDSGDADGILYYVMPYEAGHSLRERLAREGRLPINDAIVILRDVCDALAHAHRHGIVHRDIKPDNVLLAGRHAMVTDFGVAKAISAAGSSDRRESDGRPRDVLLTTAGVSLGTPAYMAPEQVAADPRIDHRADIYAFGALAYELLAGHPPFHSEEPQLVLAAHLTEQPANIATHRPEVPAALARVVMRCLEKRPADRWQTTDELLSRIERVLAANADAEPLVPTQREHAASAERRAVAAVPWRRVGVIAAGIAVVAAGVAFTVDRIRRPAADGPALDPSRIVVVPFRLSGVDSAQRNLAETVADLLSARLNGEGVPTAVDSRTVISAWNRVKAGQDATSDDARQVARMLGAGEALSGTIVGIPGNRITITANVFATATGMAYPVTGSGHVDSLASLLDVMVTRLAARRAGVSEATLTSLTSSNAALRAYLWGRVDYRRGREDDAIRQFARAVELDSTFALAALDLAIAAGQPIAMRTRWGTTEKVTTYFALGHGSPGTQSEHERIAKSIEAAWTYRDKLSSRDRPLAEALRGDGNPEHNTARVMIDALQRAIAGGAIRAETQYLLGALLLWQGRAVQVVDSRSRAAAAFNNAVELDPGYVAPLSGLVDIAAFDRDTAALRKAGELYLARDSTGPSAEYVRWRVAAGLGDSAQLATMRARFGSLSSSTLQRIVHASMLTGLDLADAERAISIVVDRASDRVDRRIALGMAYMLALNRGRPRAAAELLRRRTIEQDDLLSTWTWATMANLLWEGDSAIAISAMKDRVAIIMRDTMPGRAGQVPAELQLSRNISQQGLWDFMHGDTSRAAAAVRWLRKSDHPLGAEFVEVLLAAQTRSPNVNQLLARIDSVTREGCCTVNIVNWANLVLARAYEMAGRDRDALDAVRRGIWRFPPQLLSTFLREEGRLAAKVGEREDAIRAYRHYLALRSDPEPELEPAVDSVRAELARLEAGTRD